MELTRAERWILSNQFRLLEALYPEEADDHRQAQRILNNGYALEYGWIAEPIGTELGEAECREVYDVLTMHEALQRAYRYVVDQSGIDENRLVFHGFCGNTETGQLGYARHVMADESKFTDLRGQGHDELNSHVPTLARYRKMVTAWKQSGKTYELTPEDVRRILAAGDE